MPLSAYTDELTERGNEMTEEYISTLALLSFGKRVRAMFGFIPIEDMDGISESFFDMELPEEEMRWESSGGSDRRGHAADTVNRESRSSADRSYALRQREKSFDIENAFSGEDILFAERLHEEKAPEQRDGEERSESDGRESLFGKESRPLAKREAFRGKGGKKNAFDEEALRVKESVGGQAFDSGVWLAETHDGESGRYSSFSGAESSFMPVLARIEQTTERIEKNVSQSTALQMEQGAFDRESFSERLESVLRGEIIRNGFEL